MPLQIRSWYFDLCDAMLVEVPFCCVKLYVDICSSVMVARFCRTISI